MNKKRLLMISVASLLGAVSHLAYAGSGEVRFVGVVTDTTCDLLPKVDGAVNNLIQLGTSSVGGKAGAKDFALTLNPNQPGCVLADDGIATISWAGPLNENGLGNQSGTATDAWVNIKTINATDTSPKDINSTANSASFTGKIVKTDGAKFSAELNGGTTPGEFASAAAFVVAYK